MQETRLSDRYVMVRCQVIMHFEKNPGEPVDVGDQTVYVLFVGEGQTPRVVFTLTHGDLGMIMREHGLMP